MSAPQFPDARLLLDVAESYLGHVAPPMILLVSCSSATNWHIRLRERSVPSRDIRRTKAVFWAEKRGGVRAALFGGQRNLPGVPVQERKHWFLGLSSSCSLSFVRARVSEGRAGFGWCPALGKYILVRSPCALFSLIGVALLRKTDERDFTFHSGLGTQVQSTWETPGLECWRRMAELQWRSGKMRPAFSPKRLDAGDETVVPQSHCK